MSEQHIGDGIQSIIHDNSNKKQEDDQYGCDINIWIINREGCTHDNGNSNIIGIQVPDIQVHHGHDMLDMSYIS